MDLTLLPSLNLSLVAPKHRFRVEKLVRTFPDRRRILLLLLLLFRFLSFARIAALGLPFSMRAKNRFMVYNNNNNKEQADTRFSFLETPRSWLVLGLLNRLNQLAIIHHEQNLFGNVFVFWLLCMMVAVRRLTSLISIIYNRINQLLLLLNFSVWRVIV